MTGPRGTVVADRQLRFSNWSDLGGSNGVLDLVSGEYRITIDAAGAATGRYGFRLLDLANATPITPGTPFGGTLDPGRRPSCIDSKGLRASASISTCRRSR